MLRRLIDNLIAFQERPGQYALALRQPEIIFSEIKNVILLASGKANDVEYELLALAQQHRAIQAAQFFIRTALLRPGADHYTLFGLVANSSTAEIKERYRLMMRLTHPDYALNASNHWPEGTVPRLNKAYATLNTTVTRDEYDKSRAQLVSGGGQSQRILKTRAVISGQVKAARIQRLLIPISLVAVFVSLVILILTWANTEKSIGKVLVQKPVHRALGDASERGELAVALKPSPVLVELDTGATKASVLVKVPEHIVHSSEAAVTQAQPIAIAPSAALAGSPHSVSKSESAISGVLGRQIPRPQMEASIPKPGVSTSKQPSIGAQQLGRPVGQARTTATQLGTSSSNFVSVQDSNQSVPTVEQIFAHAPQLSPFTTKGTVGEKIAVNPLSLSHSEASIRPPTQLMVTRPVKIDVFQISPRPSLGAVEPVLVRMMEQMEKGRAELLLPMLDGPVRQQPKVLAFLVRLNSILNAAPDRRVENMVFTVDAEDSDSERLRVKGHVRFLLSDFSNMEMRRNLAMQIDFVIRSGQPWVIGIDGREVPQ